MLPLLNLLTPAISNGETTETTGDSVVLISGAAAALVALIGYMVNQYVARNERRRRIYAEALAVVFEYE